MLLEAPEKAFIFEHEAYLKTPQVAEFLNDYYSHHRFVCSPRFNRTYTGSSGSSSSYVDVDTQYPDLNAGMMLPALKVTPDSAGLTLYKWAMPLVILIGLLCFFGGEVPGIVGSVLGLAFAGCFLMGYRERLGNLRIDLANAQAPLSPQARTVLSKIVECFDPEQNGIPVNIQSVADATFYLSNLRSTMYQRIQERESAHRVKLAEVQAAAQVAYAS